MAANQALVNDRDPVEDLFPAPQQSADVRPSSAQSGVLPAQEIRKLISEKRIQSSVKSIEADQLQPASLDLRLGKFGYRVRASFLPGEGVTVAERLRQLTMHKFPLDDGPVLERDCVYVVELQEVLSLPESITALANPKSSTGRLDVFTRLITDRGQAFDRVPKGYQGKVYLEICPRTFGIKVRTGSRLNQIRFRRRTSSQEAYPQFEITDRKLRELHQKSAIVSGELAANSGLMLRVELGGPEGSIIGYKAQRFADVIDVDEVDRYSVGDFWEPLRARLDRRLILDPHQFYILASKERMRVPPDLAAEMVAIDPTMGEFRAHYAGFFDPGFGDAGFGPSARAVLEVRSHEVPFILEDGQFIGRLVFERLTARPDSLYGAAGSTSSYQSQGLKLSKHFKSG